LKKEVIEELKTSHSNYVDHSNYVESVKEETKAHLEQEMIKVAK
jgi:hypothetical protein